MLEIEYTTILMALRHFIIQITNITSVILVMRECLYKRNSYKPLIAWQLFRLIFINGIFTIILEEVRLSNPGLQKIYAIVFCMATFTTIILHVYTFKKVLSLKHWNFLKLPFFFF